MLTTKFMLLVEDEENLLEDIRHNIEKENC